MGFRATLNFRKFKVALNLKTTPYLWPKKVETYSSSKAVARNPGEEVPLDRPYHNKTKQETQVSSKTICGIVPRFCLQRFLK